jgi:hypothetical protein
MPSKWYGKEYIKEVNAIYDKRVNIAAQVVKREMKRLLSNPGRTVTLKKSKSGKVRKVYGRKGSRVSAPGEPPAKQTGALARSVFSKVKRRKNKVQVGARGRVQNSGAESINLDPRPFINQSLTNVQDQVREILTTPLPGK